MLSCDCGPSYLLVACCGSVKMLLTSDVMDDHSFFGPPSQPPLLDIAASRDTDTQRHSRRFQPLFATLTRAINTGRREDGCKSLGK